MADLVSDDTHKNDFTEKHEKKGVASDIIAFTMERCDETIVSNEGVDSVFPNDSLAVGFIYDWKQILAIHGVGKYRIRKTFTIAGITSDFIVGSYELKEFSRQTAKETVRIYSEFNSYYLKENIDFTNSNVKDTIRFNGYFGNREPETVINNLTDVGREVIKVTRENLNRYTLSTDPIEIGMSRQIDMHLLNEDLVRMSDYNRFNHSYEILDQECVLIDTPKIEYIEKDRRLKYIAIFGDRKLIDKSYYRG